VSELGERLPLGDIGSNAVALGAGTTDNGKGMMLGNPHFPWDGTERFYEAQLTIPGSVNVEGGSLLGVPVINIGHTDHLAWSHTVSTAYRFTPFELKLVPGSPTTYLYDGQPRQMRADQVTVQVKNADDTVSPRTRTLYSSHHGSIFTDLLGVPFPWTPTTAFAMGDANAGNFRYLNHFFEVNQAQSVQELQQITERNQGVPWVNTIASDSSGDAFYADISVVPHVTDEEAAVCDTELGRGTFAALGLPVLDGSLSTCEWASPAFGGPDPDALDPGTFGPSHMPKLHRQDYVTNSNDSYWLSNPNQPLEGFDRIIGDERTERSLRTRSGLVMVDQRLSGIDGWPGNTYTLQQLQDTVFSNRQYLGELWRNELATFCETKPVMTGTNGPVDVTAACPVLRNWDLHDDLDSNGAILFRRFASRALGAVPVTGTPGLFTTQFDANDPVHTPNGLNIGNPVIEQSFADAVQELRDLGIPLDAPLRGYQSERRGNEAIPIHGGPGGVGVFNAINVSGGFGSQGWTSIPHGSSFVMAAQFTDDPNCPVDARTILTYSQSTNPSSPWYADQTKMFSRKEWVDEAFCESEILSDPSLQVTRISTASGYPRPVAGANFRVPLTIAYRECDTASANRTHSGGITAPACNPAVQVSDHLTVGTRDANGPDPKSVGSVRYIVHPGTSATPEDDADVQMAFSMTDVRKKSDISDYTGTVQIDQLMRITDRANGSAFDEPATTTDIPFPFEAPCQATSDQSIGSTCAVDTTADALIPGSAVEGKRAIWELGAITVYDGGADGQASTSADNTLFARQGVFVP
jgi:acyl-homoserine-lactone acylase